MRLAPLQVTIDHAPPPARVAAFLAGASQHIDDWFARPEHQAGIGFIPSDYEPCWRALAALQRTYPDVRRMLEWGSGFGVVAGTAALLGLDAHGIEIDGDLIRRATELLAEHDVSVNLAEGSFVPADFAAADLADLDDLETRTVLDHPDAYDALGYDLDDFDLVFAYPWPTEEELYREIFRREANYGAILVTWSRQEGIRAYRKLGAVRG